MLYDFREYNDDDIPRFIWDDSKDELVGSVKYDGIQIDIQARKKNNIWHVKAKDKKKTFMNIRVRDISAQELMILTETYILDNYK